uniref:Uncharacterized protein n=1 Tax=Phakopsora pachyrhizi TaxID=170000 RepID=A0A0S1MJ68_PHAPC
MKFYCSIALVSFWFLLVVNQITVNGLYITKHTAAVDKLKSGQKNNPTQHGSHKKP